MGEIIDYISRAGDTAGQWAPRMGPLPPFFLVLQTACLGIVSCLIRLPLAGLHRPVQLLGCYICGLCISPSAPGVLAGGKYSCEYAGIISLHTSIGLLQNVKLREKTHMCVSLFSKPVCLSGLGGCKRYLLSGLRWHFIYLQETIPVFMFELNMPRRHQKRLHICNRSAGKDWHMAVNSMQTWLGAKVKDECSLSLSKMGGGMAKKGIDRGICAPSAGHIAWKVRHVPEGVREVGQTL